MVSAKKDDIDKIRGLGLGADRLYHETIQSERDGGACQGASGAL